MELLLEFIASRVPTSKFELRIQCIHVSNTSNTLPWPLTRLYEVIWNKSLHDMVLCINLGHSLKSSRTIRFCGSSKHEKTSYWPSRWFELTVYTQTFFFSPCWKYSTSMLLKIALKTKILIYQQLC